MKNQNPKESIFKKKGFYVALYSCLGVVMVIAAAVSFNNLSLLNKTPQLSQNNEVDFDKMKTTSLNNGSSLMQQEVDDEIAIYMDEEELALEDESARSNAPKITPPPAAKPDVPKSNSQAPAVTPAPSAPAPSTSDSNNEQSAKPSDKPAEKPADKKSSERTEAEELDNYYAETDAFDETDAAAMAQGQRPRNVDAGFEGFSEDTRMKWPVFGDVVMYFSDKHAIYDKTLDQYRTNDTLCIKAEVGDQVVAAADGVVEKITKTRETGKTVVIDNGNGWKTTYSQLQDRVLVKENDAITKGQVLGGVASPSIYTVLLGNHVGFKVTKDEVAVDPTTLLE